LHNTRDLIDRRREDSSNLRLLRGRDAAVDNRGADRILKSMLKYESAPIDRMFHALAEPTRRQMVERLSRGPATVSDLAKPFAMSLAAIVQHLAVLEESGIVASEKIGRVRTCRLEPKGLHMAEKWINERRLLWERRLDRLGEFLAAEDEQEDRSKKK
jgi:DNA-binding transcriptional ArsR family regulator